MTEPERIRAGGMPKFTAEAERIYAAHMTAVWAMENVTGEEREAYDISAGLLAAYWVAARRNRHVAITTVDHILEISGHDLPESTPFWGSMTDDAEFWAEWASDEQVVTLLAACMKRMVQNPLIRLGPVKKALVAIWNSLPPAEKAAFLAHVGKGTPE